MISPTGTGESSRRQTSLGSDICELIQNLPTIWFENFLSQKLSLEPIVEASGEPPKPFVGFFLGHVPEPNAEPSPQQAWSMAKTYHNTLLQKNKGKRMMHKYHKLHHRKLTWIPKIAIFELRYILNTIIWVSMLDFWGGQPLCNEKRPPSCVHLALSDPVVSGLEGSCVTSQGWALASSLADLDLQDMVKIKRWTAECGKIGLCALEFVEWGRFIYK